MKTLLIVIMYLACSLAWADSGDKASSKIDALQIRLVTIEQIDVTAEKTPSASDENLDAEIDAILTDAESLETSQD